VDTLFGIPLGAFAVALAVLLVLTFATVAFLALRNRVFLRLGVRNVTRRRSRSALIVVGLMLATAIISSSLATGDTMSRTIRSSTLHALGNTDLMVSAEGAQVDPTLAIDTSAPASYFDEALYAPVRDATVESPLVDGVAPAIIEPLAIQNLTARETEPRAVLFGSDPDRMDGFDEPRVDGTAVSLSDLGRGEVYVNADAADDVGVEAGHELRIFGRGGLVELTVRDVVEFQGAGADAPAVLAPLETAQDIVDEPGRINQVIISNTGDEVSGADHTDEVTALVAPVASEAGLEVQPVKRDGLDLADEQGNAFMSLFSTFGSFSIAAGILLIFLIFVMLAAERRTEMGIARAVGTRRGHLVQTFLYEGAVYDLIAAAVGAVLGLGVAYVMVDALVAAFASEGLAVTYDVQPQSLFVAFGLGVLLTLAVVAVSAWRVSRLDITTAIRNLPAPVVSRRRGTHWVRGLVVVALGVLVALAGSSGGQAMPFLLGVSIVIAGGVPVARVLGLPDRLAYTLAGLALVVWWLLPLGAYEALAGSLSYDFSVWIAGGLMVVLGATWTIMWNADLLLGGLSRTIGRMRSVAPVVRMAVVYPLRSRLRTAMTLAMFTLVVFTLVVGSTISGSFISGFDDIDRYSGGFDVRAVSTPMRPIGDMEAAIADTGSLDAGDVDAVGAQSMVPVEMRQAGREDDVADYPLRGVDERFMAETTYELAAVAEGYDGADDVWQAMAREPGLAVIDPLVAPRRDSFDMGATPDLTIEGFYVEDGAFEPVELEAHDPVTGTDLTVTVIGVLDDSVPWEMAGVTVSQDALRPFGDLAMPTTFWVRLADGVDADAAAASLESGFLDYGVEARSLQDSLDEAVGVSWTFNRLIQGFMGLGLVVGVVALGVISARAVVERRQHIGVLRAIGFQPAMVRLGFLIEAAFVSLTAIIAGTVLGLIMAYNVVTYMATQQHVPFAVPWLNLAIIFTTVFLAALASATVPAIRASRVYPADVLRYQ
jgi:putative ABC transport system permease protein